MRNYLKLICNYRNGKTFHSLTFYVKLCWKSGGWGGGGGVKCSPNKVNPDLFSFF